jgi:iron complex outermembrane recepter protein
MRPLLLANVVLTGLVTSAAAALGAEAPQTREFTIEAQDLGSALQSFALQSQREIFFTSELTRGKRSRGISGQHEVLAALEAILEGTGLTYSVTGSNAILVRDPKRPLSAVQGSRALHLQPNSGGVDAAGRSRRRRVDPHSAADTRRTSVSEEIVVTAQKREQSLQDVPLSLSVIGGGMLSQRGIRNFEELSGALPNFKIGLGGRADQLNIRGVGSGFNSGFEQSVATFVDGLYRGRSRAVRASFLDVERIEIIRGPQSTFFGNNAIAGALSITTRKPDENFAANASALYGDDDEYAFEGAVSLPLTGTLRTRMVGKVSGMGGYIRNQKTGDEGPAQDDKMGRVTLLWNPTPSFEATLRTDAGRMDHDDAFDYEIVNCPPDTAFGAPRGICAQYLAASGGAVDDDLDYTAALFPNFFDYRYQESGLTLNATTGKHSFTAVTGHFHHDVDILFNVQSVPLSSPLDSTAARQPSRNAESVEQFSQELRFGSTADGRIEYLLGLYYQHSELSIERLAGSYDAALGAQAQPYFRPGDLVASYNTARQQQQSASLFAFATFKPAPQLRFSLGLRYTDVEKSGERHVAIGTAAATPTLDSFAPGSVAGQAILASQLNADLTPYEDLHYDDSALMPSASAQWYPSRDTMLYVSYVNGFKAGGFSTESANGDRGEFTAEDVDSYEAGLKTSWLDRRLATHVAVFRSRYSDLQESIATVLADSNRFVTTVANVAESTAKGIEISASWRASPRFRLVLESAWLSSKYDEYVNAPCGALQNLQQTNCTQNLSGRVRAFAPEYSGSLAAAYEWPVTAAVQLTLGADLYYSDDYYLQANLDPYFKQESYTKLGARLSARSVDGRWEVGLIGKNLTDEITTGFRQGLPGSPGTLIVLPDRPRSIAVQASMSW